MTSTLPFTVYLFRDPPSRPPKLTVGVLLIMPTMVSETQHSLNISQRDYMLTSSI